MHRILVSCGGVATLAVVSLLAAILLARLGVTGPSELIGIALDRVTGSSYETLIRAPSPDGQFVAVAIATHSWDDVIGVVLEAADGHRSKSILGVTDRGPEERQVALDWVDDHTLRVTYSGDPDRVYYENAQDWGGVRIDVIETRGVQYH